ncbi:MAG: aldo/keto reductase [Acidobacteriota bacterium]
MSRNRLTLLGRRLSRREFMAALATAAAFAPEVLAMQKPGPRGIPLRPLGKTGVDVPIVAYGGWHSAAGKSEAESVRLLEEAIDLGFTFWENAWEYHNGLSEVVQGKALKNSGRRDEIFLMTKACARDFAGFQKHLDDSLRRLQTDHVDLLQFHSIQYSDDPEVVFDPERGGLKAALQAREAGKLRFIGFSGHMFPAVHRRMLEGDFAWDTIQIPLNPLDAHYRSFQHEILPEARRRGIGVLGMKSLGGGSNPAALPGLLGLSPELLRRYALSLPVSSVVCGMQTREQVLGMAKLAREFQPLTEEEVREVLAKSASQAAGGSREQYKNPASGYGCSYQDQVYGREGRLQA